MSNVSEIVSAVASAKIALGDLVVRIVLTKVTNVYNPATGKVAPTTTTKEVDIAIMAYDFIEIDGTNIRADDLKGIVFNTDQVIDTDDKLTFGGVKYSIHSVKQLMAGLTIVALEIQFRK